MNTNGFSGPTPAERRRRRWLARREAAIRAAERGEIAGRAARAAAAEAAAQLEPTSGQLDEIERRLEAMEAALLASQRRVLETQEHLARRLNELGASLAALRRDTSALAARRNGGPGGGAAGEGPTTSADGRAPGTSPAPGAAPTGPVDYDALVRRVRALIEATVPAGAQLCVVSRGDASLLEVGDRTARHFPVDDAGSWAGYHPEDSEAAIEHLERLKAGGVGYFVLPHASFWWLDYYEAFARYLETRYRLLAHRDDTARIYALDEAGARARGRA